MSYLTYLIEFSMGYDEICISYVERQNRVIKNELDIRTKMTETKVQPKGTSPTIGDGGEAVADSKGMVAENVVKPTEPMYWYVACVRVNNEKKFKEFIEGYFKKRKLALETWLPLEKRVIVNSRGKRVIRDVVILTTFVFVRVEAKNLNEIRFRPDVYKMLSEPGKYAPCIISDSIFENFRRIVDSGRAEMQNHPIKKGDKVRIIDGELTGVVAYVQRIVGNKALIGNEIRNISGATIEIEKEKLQFFQN